MGAKLNEFIGRVVEITPKFKAVLEFKFGNKTERALLMYDKLRLFDGPLPEGGSIDTYIELGTVLKFLCHPFDSTGADRCQWYIRSAWMEAECGKNKTVFNGLYNCTGHVTKLNPRQGVLRYSNNGVEENVMFLASKLFIKGKRVSVKANLNQLSTVEEGHTLSFDAVPCDTTDDDNNCQWFATVVWKGRKPRMEYDDVRATRNKPAKLPKANEIKLITSNPHMEFLRTEGVVMKILNAEYGLALAMIEENHWESVLFHRSVAMLFDISLKDKDLTEVFKEEDRLMIVAAAPGHTKFGVRWVASQIRIYIDPSIRHMFKF